MTAHHLYSWQSETPADAAERLGIEPVGVELAIRDGELECLPPVGRATGKIAWLDPAVTDAWAKKRGILAFQSKTRPPRARRDDAAPASAPKIPAFNAPREQALANAAKQLGLDPARVATVGAELEGPRRPLDPVEAIAKQLGVDPDVMRKNLEERRRRTAPDETASVDPVASVADQCGVDPEDVHRNLEAYRRGDRMELDLTPGPRRRAIGPSDDGDATLDEFANVADQLGVDPEAMRANYAAAMRQLHGGRS